MMRAPTCALIVLLGTSSAVASPYESSDVPYFLRVDARPVRKGYLAAATVSVTPAAEYLISSSPPPSIVLEAADGLQFAERQVDGIEEPDHERRVTFRIRYRAQKQGPRVVRGTLRMGLCTIWACEKRETTLSFEVEVTGG